jgi:hypothetical protein
MAGELHPLIPRETLLGSPKRWQPRLSPDGARLAYLAPNERDVLQIWVRTLGQDNGRCVSLAPRSVQFYGWSWDSKTIFYAQEHRRRRELAYSCDRSGIRQHPRPDSVARRPMPCPSHKKREASWRGACHAQRPRSQADGRMADRPWRRRGDT